MARFLSDAQLEEELARRKAQRSKRHAPTEDVLAPKRTVLSKKQEKELGLVKTNGNYSDDTAREAMNLLSNTKGSPAIGAKAAFNKMDGAIPLGTLDMWRRVLKDIRGRKLAKAIDNLMTRKAGNPNLKKYLSDPEKRAFVEYLKARKTAGRGMNRKQAQGTGHRHHGPTPCPTPPPAVWTATAIVTATATAAAIAALLRCFRRRSPDKDSEGDWRGPRTK